MRVRPRLPSNCRSLYSRTVKTSHVISSQSPSSTLPPNQTSSTGAVTSGARTGFAVSCGCVCVLVCAGACGSVTVCAGCCTAGVACTGVSASTCCTGAVASSAGRSGRETAVPGRQSFSSTTSHKA